MYSAWRFSLQSLTKKTLEKTHPHWRIDKKITSSTATSTTTSTTSQSSSNNKSQSQAVSTTQSQLPIFPTNQSQIVFHTSQQLKRIKANDNGNVLQLPKLMMLNSNSCRFDTFLAWLFFFISTDEPDLLSKKDLRCHPYRIFSELIELMKKQDFKNAQTKFLNYCKTSKIDVKITEMGNYFLLMKNLLNDKFSQFIIEYEETAKCTNKKCTLAYEKKPFIEHPYSIAYLEEYRNRSQGILENWFHIVSLQTTDENNCLCNSKKTDKLKLTIDKNVKNLPRYLNLNLESCFDENNVFKSNLIDKIEMEEFFSFTLQDSRCRYELISIVLFENKNHYSLLYKEPEILNCSFESWIYYSDISGEIKLWKEIKYSQLVNQNKIPVALTYRLTYL
jgi:hypothetical protein